MGQLPKDLMEKIAKSRAGGGGTNIRYGEYLLMIRNVVYEQKYTGRCLIWEFRVVEAKKITVVEGTKTIEVEPNATGSECSSVINFDGKGKLSAEGNAKAIILGLFGLKEDQVSDADVMSTLGDVVNQQAARGMLIRCATYPKEVRSRPGNYITGLNWSCAAKPGEGSNSAEEVAKRMALETAASAAPATASA